MVRSHFEDQRAMFGGQEPEEFFTVPNIRWLLALITNIHRWIYLKSGGWVGKLMGWKKRALLLTHKGRQSGRSYIVPLLYVEDADNFVVVGSNAGDLRDPQWWLNLKAHPETTIQVGRSHHGVRARKADPEEAKRLWPVLESHYSFFDDYRERAHRELPVVLLEPR